MPQLDLIILNKNVFILTISLIVWIFPILIIIIKRISELYILYYIFIYKESRIAKYVQ